MDRVLRNKKTILVFLLPTLFFYILTVIYPMYASLYFTFFEGTPNVNMHFVGLKNYAKLFTDREFAVSFSVTIRFLLMAATGYVLLGFICAMILAYCLPKRWSDLGRTILYLPIIIPSVAVSGVFTKIFALAPNYGLINSLLDLVGLHNLIQPWTSQSSTALSTVLITDLWRGTGYYALLFYAGWLNVPTDMEEAARLDGCGTLRIIRHIVLPTIKPVTIMVIVLAVTYALKVYDTPLTLTNGGPGRATEVLSMYMYKVAFANWKYGYGSTIAIVMLVLSLGLAELILIFNRRQGRN